MAKAERRGREVDEAVANVIAAWAGSTLWGQVMLHLWNGDPDNEDLTLCKNVVGIIQMLRQVPLQRRGSGSGITLRSMSGASRKAWRHMLADAVKDDEELRSVVTEALLWFGPDAEDHFVQLAALQANGEDAAGGATAMKLLIGHPAERVAMRARSALHLLTGVPDPMDALLNREPDACVIPSPRRSSRTWLNDLHLEQILVDLRHGSKELGRPGAIDRFGG